MTWMYPAMWYHDRVFLLRCSVSTCGNCFFLTSVFHKNQLFRIDSGIGIYREFALPKCGKSDVFSPTHTVFLKRLHIFWDKIRSIFFRISLVFTENCWFQGCAASQDFQGKNNVTNCSSFFHLFLAKMWANIMCVSKVRCLLFFSQTIFFRIETCCFFSGNSLVFPRICWFQSRLLGLLPKISREKRACQFCNCI